MRTQRIILALSFIIPMAAFSQGIAPDPAVEQQDNTLKARHTARKQPQAQRQSSGPSAAVGAPTTGTKANMTEQKMISAIESCEMARTAAKGVCAEWLSPEIATFVKEYGTLVSVATTAVGSMADQCKGLGEMLNKGNMVLGAYQVACATAQGICTSKCNAALDVLGYSIKENSAAAKEAGTYVSNPVTAEAAALALKHYGAEASTFLTSEKQNLVGKIEFCQKFQISTANAVIGAVTALKGMQQTKNCEQKMADDGGVNCNDPKNFAYSQKSCMCTRNELPAAECQNMTVGLNGGVKPVDIAHPNKTGSSLSGDRTPGDTGFSIPGGSVASVTPDAGGAGAPVNGGSGAAGGGGGSGGAQDGVANGRKLNTNVLGGGFGGGGGGGFGSGPGYGETDPRLKAYAPGGAKDPNRTVASQVAKEVTAQAGRSNWEKVRSRYVDNASKLMGR